MSFQVKKQAPMLIGPSEPTASQTLPLSFMDRLPNMRFFLELILVFGHGNNNPAQAIRQALPRALVPYYPLAGRIFDDDDDKGEAAVVCSDDGVVFVEASADCSLGDVNYLDRPPLMIQKEELLPSPPLSEGCEKYLIFMMQVTQFMCGGFTVGINFNHAVLDGIGAAQFVQAVSEEARGLAGPTIKPIWCRESIPSPPKLPQKPQTPATFKFERHVVDISMNYINQVKDQFMAATGQKCSVFEIVAAKIWQCRTRAISLDEDVDQVTLRFPANVRREIANFVGREEGYYGNCIYHAAIQASSLRVVSAPLTELVGLIGEAKKGLPAKFCRWMKGDLSKEETPKLSQTYALLDLSDWRRLGFFEVDYGWGTPVHVVPANDGVKVGSCIFLNPPAPRMGARVMTHCVVKQHFKVFCEEMEKWACGS